MDERFCQIPESLFVRLLDVSPATRSVVIAVRFFMDKRTGEAWPSQQTIAEFARCHLSTVKNAVNEAREAGIMITEKRGRHLVYRFTTGRQTATNDDRCKGRDLATNSDEIGRQTATCREPPGRVNRSPSDADRSPNGDRQVAKRRPHQSHHHTRGSDQMMRVGKTELSMDVDDDLRREIPDGADTDTLLGAMTRRKVTRRRAQRFAADAAMTSELLRRVLHRTDRAPKASNGGGYVAEAIAAELEAARAEADEQQRARSDELADERQRAERWIEHDATDGEIAELAANRGWSDLTSDFLRHDAASRTELARLARLNGAIATGAQT